MLSWGSPSEPRTEADAVDPRVYELYVLKCGCIGSHTLGAWRMAPGRCTISSLFEPVTAPAPRRSASQRHRSLRVAKRAQPSKKKGSGRGQAEAPHVLHLLRGVTCTSNFAVCPIISTLAAGAIAAARTRICAEAVAA